MLHICHPASISPETASHRLLPQAIAGTPVWRRAIFEDFERPISDRSASRGKWGCAGTDHMRSAAVARPGTGLSTRERLKGRMAALLAVTARVSAGGVSPGACRSVDATWIANPGSG